VREGGDHRGGNPHPVTCLLHGAVGATKASFEVVLDDGRHGDAHEREEDREDDACVPHRNHGS
jgi:hypothetical protein